MAREVGRDLRGTEGKTDGMGEDRARRSATGGRARRSRSSPSKREGGGAVNPLMPGLRIREDGWTVARTRVFLAVLTQTGCVADAARVAGVSTTSVNRSRRLFPRFDRACGAARSKALRGLRAVAYERAVEGRETVIYRGGKEVERRIQPSDSMLALLLKQGRLDGDGGSDRGSEGAAGYGAASGPGPGGYAEDEPGYDPDAMLSAAEFMQGWRFDVDGCKYFHPTSARAKLYVKIRAMQKAVGREEAETGNCRRCGQPLTAEQRERFAAQDAADDAERSGTQADGRGCW